MEKFELKAKSFKKMEDPVLGKDGKTKYVCYVQANSIPLEFDDWMATNPREQKMTTNVASKIKDSLKENSNFHELNRGIVLSVKEVSFDNSNGILTIEMEDPEIHGNIDGGHTLRAILDAQASNVLQDERYVFVELFTGLESPVELAAARNTSVQVDLKSIAELENNFAILKEAFADCEFSNRIAYKMNEHYNVPNIIPIDVREVLSVLIMFSQNLYPLKTSFGTLSEVQPVQCYTGKETTLRKFLNMSVEERNQMIYNVKPLIKDIFAMYDKIEKDFAAVSNSNGKRYGTRKYAKYDGDNIVGKTEFTLSDIKYIVPKGIIYPLLASFRALIKVNDDGTYEWIKDPFETWDVLAGKLSTIILDEKTENPEILGKNSNLWSNLFKEVYIFAYL